MRPLLSSDLITVRSEVTSLGRREGRCSRIVQGGFGNWKSGFYQVAKACPVRGKTDRPADKLGALVRVPATVKSPSSLCQGLPWEHPSHTVPSQRLLPAPPNGVSPCFTHTGRRLDRGPCVPPQLPLFPPPRRFHPLRGWPACPGEPPISLQNPWRSLALGRPFVFVGGEIDNFYFAPLLFYV